MFEEVDQRIRTLEEKMTYQEQIIDALNDVIIEQQAQLNNMTEQFRRFELLIETLHSHGDAVIPNPPPPHY